VGNRAEGLSCKGRRGGRGLEGRRDDAQGLPAGGPGDDSECRATPDPSPRESVSGGETHNIYSQHTGWRRKSAAPKVIAALILPTIGAPGFEPGTFWSQTRRATGLRYAPIAPEPSRLPPKN